MAVRRAIAWTLIVAMLSIVIVVGILWTIFFKVGTTTQSSFQNQFPYGVYNPDVDALVNLGLNWMPFIILLSVIIMVIIALQRRRTM